MLILSNDNHRGNWHRSCVSFKKAHDHQRSIWISTDICLKLKADTKKFAAIVFDGDKLRIQLLAVPFYQGISVHRLSRAGGNKTKSRLVWLHEQVFPESAFPTAIHVAEVVRGVIVVKIPGCEKRIKRVLQVRAQKLARS